MCPRGREQEQGGTILKAEMQMKVLKEKKKEGEKYKEEENKSSWWNTNGVLARYHLPRKLHFYLGINECKTCLRPR